MGSGSSKFGDGKIWIEFTVSKPYFAPGDIIEGKVFLKLDKPFSLATHIEAYLYGIDTGRFY